MRIASVFGVAVVSVFMWLGLRAPASAVQIPPGSYRVSCESIQLSGGILTARCSDINGAWHEASLNMDRCPGGPVANNNGVLVCGPGGYGISRGLPRGSWRASCRDASLNRGLLVAQCDNGSGGWQSSTLDFDDCATKLVGNSRGYLYCEGVGGGMSQDLPPGSWRATCRDAHQNGFMLYAQCDTGNGTYRSASLDTGLCPDGAVKNVGGALYCQNGRASSILPQGSWRTSCRNGYIEGSTLYAQCNNGAGSWQQTSIDLRRCSGPIGNVRGNLVCEYGRRGNGDDNGNNDDQ